MQEKIIESNMVSVTGKIVSEFRQSREGRGEVLYIVDVLVRRISGVTDRIPFIVPSRLVDVGDYIGCMVSAEGLFRSYNRREGGRSRLVLAVFVKEFRFLEEERPVDCRYNNRVFLSGYICKPPKYRRTPKGKEIADIILAVNRAHGESDYIPCIVWGEDARDVASTALH